MTSQQSPRPHTEAAPIRLAFLDPGPGGEAIRHILIGILEGVRAAIYAMYLKRYVEQALWTGPINIGPSGIHIPHSEGRVMAYLTRLRAFDALT